MRIDIEQCKEQFAELLGKLQLGDERQIIITRHGMPIAKLTDYYTQPLQRRTGLAKGKFVIPDDWDVKDAEIAEMFGVN